MRIRSFAAVFVLPVLAAVTPVAGADPAPSGEITEFTVLAKAGHSIAEVEQVVRDSGGTVLRGNEAVGLITAAAPATGFLERVGAGNGVFGVARADSIGKAPKDQVRKPSVEHRALAALDSTASVSKPPVGNDPLDAELWGLKSVRADLAHSVEAGDRRVKVGVLDSGIDATHPDIAPNFDSADSRSFVRETPVGEAGAVAKGPCKYAGCIVPADRDDNGHGTHVAATIAAAADGFGISGVAPNVTLVSIRVADDSGAVFVEPVVDALTYAADTGIAVVNMSFYVDPWLYNCDHNPADTPQQQMEQHTIVEAVSRALDYAYRKGVTSVAGLGNEHTDLGAPLPDLTSPGYPDGAAHSRTIDNATCLSMPAEGPHTIGVSAFGPSGKKADYSDYGTERTSVSAPGGFLEDGYGTDRYRTPRNKILSAYPRYVAVESGDVDADGNVTPGGAEDGVRKATTADGRTGYYQYLEGTSMATPHATGVAALIISHYGRPGPGGFGLNPDAVRRILEGTAAKTPCPESRTVDYLKEGDDASYTATCEGTPEFNGFYGHGVVDAYAAVTRGAPYLG